MSIEDELEWSVVRPGVPPGMREELDIRLIDFWHKNYRLNADPPVCSVCDGSLMHYRKLQPAAYVIGKPPGPTGQALCCALCEECAAKPPEFIIIALRSVLAQMRKELN